METSPWNTQLKVETHLSGPFVFQAGINLNDLTPLIQRVEDAREFFNKIPLYPQVMAQLNHVVLVGGIHGTNTIEGGTESSEEIDIIVNMPLEKIKEDSQRRIRNLKKAYAHATDFALSHDRVGEPRLVLVEEMFTDLHREITEGLNENEFKYNAPGAYRNPQKGIEYTQVGHTSFGGVYKPPKCLPDIVTLMKSFIEWANSEPIITLPAIIRAPLVHFYFEMIHPFGDGNGRTGRLIETMILKAAGFKYADFLINKYYNDNLERYMALFNDCRKREEKHINYWTAPRQLDD